MKEKLIQKITRFPDNVYPMPHMMREYVIDFWKETGKPAGKFPNIVTTVDYEEAKKYYKKGSKGISSI